MKEICKKDRRYKEVIIDCYLVKNAVILLGGRRRENSEEGEKKGEEKTVGEGGKEEGKQIGCIEMRVGEKIMLIELLCELVKEGMEMREEEEMKEVLMELEEEGNQHIEEEIEGETEEEKREWEELSEKARNLVWLLEKMETRRAGKKSQTLRIIREQNQKLEAAKARLEEENASLKKELSRFSRRRGRRDD